MTLAFPHLVGIGRICEAVEDALRDVARMIVCRAMNGNGFGPVAAEVDRIGPHAAPCSGRKIGTKHGGDYWDVTPASPTTNGCMLFPCDKFRATHKRAIGPEKRADSWRPDTARTRGCGDTHPRAPRFPATDPSLPAIREHRAPCLAAAAGWGEPNWRALLAADTTSTVVD